MGRLGLRVWSACVLVLAVSSPAARAATQPIDDAFAADPTTYSATDGTILLGV